MLEPLLDRNTDGTFAKGHQALNKPYRRYGETLRVMEGKYNTGQIIALAANQEALNDMNPFEVMAIRHLARSAALVPVDTCADVRQEREALLDRLEGKPKDTEKSSGDDGKIVIQIIQFGNKDSAHELGKIIENQTAVAVHAKEENRIENSEIHAETEGRN